MAWDFETDPEFQTQLDWIDEFVKAEIEPLELVLGSPAEVKNPNNIKLIRPLQAPGQGARALGLSSGTRTRRSRLWPGQAGADKRDPGPRQLRADRVRLPGAR